MSAQLRIGTEKRGFVRSAPIIAPRSRDLSCLPSDALFHGNRAYANVEADKLLFGNADHNGCEYFGLRTEYVLYLQLQSVVLDLRVNELEQSHSVNNL